MENKSAIERCYGVAMARLAEAFYYTKIPIRNFLDIGSGTGFILDVIEKYLPSNKDVFYAVEKYPPEEEKRTKSKNYFTSSYKSVGKVFDCGLCIEVIEHLTPKMLVELFGEVASVSNNGALFLINSGQPEYVKNENPNYLDPFVRGHIVSYSIEGLKSLLLPLGFKVYPIRGKTWLCAIEYNVEGSENEDITDRIWNALPENLNILCDREMGSVLKILGLESVRAYLA